MHHQELSLAVSPLLCIEVWRERGTKVREGCSTAACLSLTCTLPSGKGVAAAGAGIRAHLGGAGTSISSPRSLLSRDAIK